MSLNETDYYDAVAFLDLVKTYSTASFPQKLFRMPVNYDQSDKFNYFDMRDFFLNRIYLYICIIIKYEFKYSV